MSASHQEKESKNIYVLYGVGIFYSYGRFWNGKFYSYVTPLTLLLLREPIFEVGLKFICNPYVCTERF